MAPVGSIGLFPGKLHNLLEYSEQHNRQDAISWVDDGTAFIVNDAKKLEEILPKFFSQTKYKSFQRQLNMWCFERINHGVKKGYIKHPYFVKGKKSLCKKMTRQNEHEPSSQPETEAAALAGVIPVSQLFDQQQNQTIGGDDSSSNHDNMIQSSSRYNCIGKGNNSSNCQSDTSTSTSSLMAASTAYPAAASSLLLPTVTTTTSNNNYNGFQPRKEAQNQQQLQNQQRSSTESSSNGVPVYLPMSCTSASSSMPWQQQVAVAGNAIPTITTQTAQLPTNSVLSTCFGLNTKDVTTTATTITSQQQQQQLQQQQGQLPLLPPSLLSHNNFVNLETGDLVEFEGRTFHYLDRDE